MLRGVFRAIAFFKVGWDQLASSAGPPKGNVVKRWWAGAAKRHLSHPTSRPTLKRHWLQRCIRSSSTTRLERDAFLNSECIPIAVGKRFLDLVAYENVVRLRLQTRQSCKHNRCLYGCDVPEVDFRRKKQSPRCLVHLNRLVRNPNRNRDLDRCVRIRAPRVVVDRPTTILKLGNGKS